jgi:hypothetical protein
MKRLVLPGLACALAVAVVGCGPMKTPLPDRFSEEGQKVIDDSWNRAFTPPDKLTHQELLDVMVGTQAYQLGVDTFMLRAEKRFAGGKVVMEVWFDRARPDDDRFEVSVYDTAGKLLRTERYTRKEIDETYNALFVIIPEDSPHKDLVPPARRAEHKARWDKIRSLFPEMKDEKKIGDDGKTDEAPRPRPKG